MMVRLYCLIGSDRAPDTAGPKMKPVLIAQLSRAIPKAWLLSSEVSEATALSVLLTAKEI